MRLLISIVVFLWSVIGLSQQQNDYWPLGSTKNVNVRIGATWDCDKLLEMKEDVSTYNLYMDLAGVCKTVNESSFGFTCSYFFRQKDDFVLLGNQICVDVQGVPETFKRHTQLRMKVIDGHSRKEIKSVYSTSRLPSGEPAYYCINASHNTIVLSVSVRHSVNLLTRVCPQVETDDVMKLGTVVMKPMMLISTLQTKRCYPRQTEPSFLLKVDVGGRRPCETTFHNALLSPEIFGCLQLVYVSKDYICDAAVSLNQEKGGSEITISLPREFYGPAHLSTPLCRTFEVQRDNFPYLKVWRKQGYCSGQFAVNISLTNTIFQGNEDTDAQSEKMRHVYMAVFVSLTAVCLIILGLTCVCCLRNRAKRLRNTQRRHLGTPSALNAGFQGPIVDPGSASLTWSQSNPGQVAGLPTYEEVIQGGSNPSSNPDIEEDKPPSYDSLYVSET